jgi:hypothetical protein
VVHTLVSVMSAADRVHALRRHGFTAAVDRIQSWIEARHRSGLRLAGHWSLLTAALCYGEECNPESALAVAGGRPMPAVAGSPQTAIPGPAVGAARPRLAEGRAASSPLSQHGTMK